MKATPIKVIELFAGVGGFRIGLEGLPNSKRDTGFKIVWANQWEPGSDKRQFAFNCYQSHFDPKGKNPSEASNVDIKIALDQYEAGDLAIPDCDMVVGGFPCQDYSVAKLLSQSGGIDGKKGVLWWQIYRLLKLKQPRFLLLENVDRLLKSPASQRGRDFAIMLSCLYDLGYSVEWRVINAADYGFPQKRRRVYIFADRQAAAWSLEERLLTSGVMAEAFPVKGEVDREGQLKLAKDIAKTSDTFGIGDKVSRFQNAGVMQNGRVYTANVNADFRGKRRTLESVLVPDEDVPKEFFVADSKAKDWEYLKGSKKIPRTSKEGYDYVYSEGGMAFPDNRNQPARTILTGEGGSTPSRFKHIIKADNGKYRRLVPDELDQLQGFPKGWTNTGMTNGNRAFCMGNALVVGIPRRIGSVIKDRYNAE
jgi:DNA (cytosine-5)-methyltransferase 1